MSGIAVLYNTDGSPVNRDHIGRLVQSMAWRGADQQGGWAEGSVGLGSVQMWTTPEEWSTNQPLSTTTGCRIVFDGRLDNREELLPFLDTLAVSSCKPSDAELVLRSYERWGRRCVERLVGPFAFAIWDRRESWIFCARDPVGHRSLFYHWRDDCFSAATTIQQLRALPYVRLSINDDYIWDYLCSPTAGIFVHSWTPFKEVLRLPAGHTLTVTAGGVRLERYWRPWDLPMVRYRNDSEYKEHFRMLFATIVRAQCRSRTDVGVALSGGLDSSSIACMARALEGEGRLPVPAIHTYTNVWERSVQGLTTYNERHYAEAVEAKYGGPAHYVVSDEVTPFDCLLLPPPVRDTPVPMYVDSMRLIFQTASEVGVRVLLAGFGGDEILTGNHFLLLDLLREGSFRDAAVLIKTFAAAWHRSYLTQLVNPVLVGVLPRYLGSRMQQAVLTPDLNLNLPTRFHWQVPEWMPNQAELRWLGVARHRYLDHCFPGVANQMDFERYFGICSDDTRWTLLEEQGFRTGVDVRTPFFDRRLVEFLLTIPAYQRFGAGENKRILRRALADELPVSIRKRLNKTGYSFVVTQGLRRHWTLVQSLLANSRAATAGYIDLPAFTRALELERHGGTFISNKRALVATLGLELWLRGLEAKPSVNASTVTY